MSESPVQPDSQERPGPASPASGEPAAVTLKGLSNRLKIKTPMVRKIAVFDLIKHQQEFGVSEVAQVLMKHLVTETNPALQVRIIEFLGQSSIVESKDVLEAMTSDNPAVTDAICRATEALRNQG